MITTIPLALYIHIPWCVKKCPYCDFNSHQLQKHKATDFKGYVDVLLADAKMQIGFVQGREITSIFFGGGTPSLLPTIELKRLMHGLRAMLPISADAEITLEVNPGTVEHSPFEEYLETGVNRVSMGIQTFNSQKLEKLGRIHTGDNAVQAVQNAQKAGFKRINIDLMHGLPGQSIAEAQYDVEKAISLAVEHISWYQLTIEPNTVFYKSKPVLPVEDNLADIQEIGETLLNQAGFKNYEVSAWTKDKKCLHNITYWQFGDYLSIGAGAHGKITVFEDDKWCIKRFHKKRAPKDYVQTVPPPMQGFKTVLDKTLPFEFMMNALRLREGVPTEYYEQRTGLAIDTVADTLTHLAQKGLINAAWQSKIACTDLGFNYLNQVLTEFD